MPEIPFRYYMIGFRDFVMAGDFEHEARMRPVVSSGWSWKSSNRNRGALRPSCLNCLKPSTMSQGISPRSTPTIDIYGDFLDLAAQIYASNGRRFIGDRTVQGYECEHSILPTSAGRIPRY